MRIVMKLKLLLIFAIFSTVTLQTVALTQVEETQTAQRLQSAADEAQEKAQEKREAAQRRAKNRAAIAQRRALAEEIERDLIGGGPAPLTAKQIEELN